MDKARLQDVASLGGRRAQAGGKVHRWTRGADGTAAAAAFKAITLRKAREQAPSVVESLQQGLESATRVTADLNAAFGKDPE
jgi:hypothetical protein